MTSTPDVLPSRVSSGLVRRRVGDETLVLVERNGEAHRLDADAARLWDLCDGRMAVVDAASTLSLSPAQVRGAVASLVSAGLAESASADLSRRSLLRRSVLVGGGALTLPLVESVLAPLAAAAASTVPTTTMYDVYSSTVAALGKTTSPKIAKALAPFAFYQVPQTSPAAAMAPGAAASTSDLEVRPNKYVVVNAPYTETTGSKSLEGFAVNSTSPAAADSLPFFVVNRAAKPYSRSTFTVPPKTFETHPGQTSSAVIGFVAPSPVTVTNLVIRAVRNDTVAVSGTNNGVYVRVVLGPVAGGAGTVLAAAVLTAGSYAPTLPPSLALATGQGLYVVVNNNGNFNNDSTGIAFTLTTTG